jgi:hypothetical protein
MLRKVAMTLMTLSLGGCLLLISPPASEAQPGAGGGAGAPPASGGSTVAPRGGGGSAVAPRGGGGVAVAPRAARTTVTPRATRTVTTPRTTRTVTPGATRTVIPRTTRTVTPGATRTSIPRTTRTVTPGATRTGTPRAIRTVTPGGSRAVTSARLRGASARGASRFIVGGQNYSAWRSGYRVRRGSGWRTFVALGALGAIAIGSNQYYPYAYISAPEPYCDGLTEDGCQLMWQEVETIEGDVINQCVAYCPWQ